MSIPVVSIRCAPFWKGIARCASRAAAASIIAMFVAGCKASTESDGGHMAGEYVLSVVNGRPAPGGATATRIEGGVVYTDSLIYSDGTLLLDPDRTWELSFAERTVIHKVGESGPAAHTKRWDYQGTWTYGGSAVHLTYSPGVTGKYAVWGDTIFMNQTWSLPLGSGWTTLHARLGFSRR